MSDTSIDPYQSTETGVGGGISFRNRTPVMPAAVADPSAISSTGLGSARDVLASILKDGLNKGAYDSTQDFKKYIDLLNDASKRTSPEELQANELLEQAKAMNKQAAFEQANPLPSPTLLHAQDVPSLTLPGVPQDVKPHPNAVASLGAGIAGLFAPRAAGQFGAKALEGAVIAAERENVARREKYRFDLQQSLLKHEEEVRRADAQAKVEAENSRMTNAFTVEQHAENLKAATDRYKAEQLSGTAGVLQKFVEGNKPADIAKAQASALGEQIDMRQKESKEALDRITRASEMILKIDEQSAIAKQREQDRADVLKETERKDRETAVRYEREDRIRQQAEARQERHAQAMEDIQRSHLSIEEKNVALRAIQINYAHQDRQEATKQRGTSSRSATMHHETPEETSAKVDMNYLKGIAEAAQKSLNAVSNPSDELKSTARTAQAAYNRARENYQRIGNAARAEEDRHRLPGMPPPGARILRFDAQGNPIP